VNFNLEDVSLKYTFKKKMPILGFKPTRFVSEKYCYHTLTGSATTSCGEQQFSDNIHPLQQSITKLMNFNSRFNLKFSK
jgi:hypothetical protein